MADNQVSGLDVTLARMKELPLALRRKGFRAAARKGANVVRDQARQNARKVDDPATREQISKNIVAAFASRASKASGDIVFRVGVRGGAKQYANTRENVRKGLSGKTYQTLGDKKNPGGDTWYWRFIELGTARTSAQPFLRPAGQQSGDAAFRAIASAMETELSKAIQQMGE